MVSQYQQLLNSYGEAVIDKVRLLYHIRGYRFLLRRLTEIALQGITRGEGGSKK